jgi:ssDNA-binding Zn-finger/Zn-ribbon topoisomerase 1
MPISIPLESLFKPCELAIEDFSLEDYRPKFPDAQSDLICPDCGALMTLRDTKKFPLPFYGCTKFPACRGKHGATRTGAPAGIPADAETRAGRRKIMLLMEHNTCHFFVPTVITEVLGTHIGVASLNKTQCDLVLKEIFRRYPYLMTRYDTLAYDEEFANLLQEEI